MTGICIYCGKIFETTSHTSTQKYCSQKCYRADKKVVTQPDSKSTASQIIELASLAKAAGMSYGQYVARMEYGKRG